MSHQEALKLLTDGYQPVAQMTIALADELGFIDSPDFILISARGDESSAGLPFVITPKCNSFNYYEFPTYDTQGMSVVSPHFQVLVYQVVTPPPLTTEQQINILYEFARQFPENSLIAKFLNPNLIEWLTIHSDTPDIWYAWYYESITSAQCDPEELI